MADGVSIAEQGLTEKDLGVKTGIKEGPIEQTRPTIPEEAIQQLVNQIEQGVISSEHFVWGHGTSTRELAEKILREGIVVNSSYTLTEIAVPLTTKDKPPHENAQAVVDAATHWPHKNSKGVILISIPNGFRVHQVVEEINLDGKPRTRIPTRFLQGFVDGEKLDYKENPLYETKPAPTTTRLTQFPQGLPTRSSSIQSQSKPPIPDTKPSIKGHTVW